MKNHGPVAGLSPKRKKQKNKKNSSPNKYVPNDNDFVENGKDNDKIKNRKKLSPNKNVPIDSKENGFGFSAKSKPRNIPGNLFLSL